MLRRTAISAALLGLLLPAYGHAGSKPVGSADLPRLIAQLKQVTAKAQALSDALETASAQDVGLRIAFDEAEQQRQDAQFALDARAREVYEQSGSAQLGSWLSGIATPDLQEVAHAGERASMTVDQSLIDAVTGRQQALHALEEQANAFRQRLMPQVDAVLAAQDQARALLAQAQAIAAAEHAAAIARLLDKYRHQLDDASEKTTLSLTPGQLDRARAALAREAPILALLEAAGSGYPSGYTPTGEVITGIASWYGPGFVGSPTASGAPYDPEQLTCAHKTLPLGTVIHVVANGRAVNCLVDDRGPYVDGRVLDMSRAGARALGYDGLAQVTIEVLTPTG